MKTNNELYNVIKKYFAEIDDYYEAKDAIIKDLNNILKKNPWGDEDGVIDKNKLILAKEAFNKELYPEKL